MMRLNSIFKTDTRPSEITPRKVLESRRSWMKYGALSLAGIALPARSEDAVKEKKSPLSFDKQKSKYSTNEEKSSYSDITSYNNFYEFGTGKEDPAQYAHQLNTDGWTVEVVGEVLKPRIFDVDQMMSLAPLEERIYRLRCVEAWSMVIPWLGLPLSKILNEVQPTGNARFVEFVSLHDPEQMPGQRRPSLDWPYTEGLRIDEAMNPLTLLTMGLYGELLPNQNGAPVRLVVPWKYGFKSSKSIVTIRLTEHQPRTSWNHSNPSEYGFYSNVNPNVSHPRWSQRKERRIGEFFKRDTELFNGYSEWVSGMYGGMDLSAHF